VAAAQDRRDDALALHGVIAEATQRQRILDQVNQAPQNSPISTAVGLPA
jgi:hypothetical protein